MRKSSLVSNDRGTHERILGREQEVRRGDVKVSCTSERSDGALEGRIGHGRVDVGPLALESRSRLRDHAPLPLLTDGELHMLKVVVLAALE